MLFGFNIHMTQNDYLDFNNCAFETNAQMKRLKSLMRALLAVIFLLPITTALFDGDFLLSTLLLIGAVPVQVFFNKLFDYSIKSSYKKVLNDDDELLNGYSLEFYEDSLKSFTNFSKEEYLYAGIKNVYIYKNRAVYFFISGMKAYVVPASAFASADSFNEFITFVRYKFPNTSFVY